MFLLGVTKKPCIAVIGLGYVGLPLAVEFGKQRRVIGYDINLARVKELESGRDGTLEVTSADLASAVYLTFTSDLESLHQCAIYIVTVPTPIDDHKRPDLGPLLGASADLGSVLKRGDYVIYESTVYPGATEERCVPVLESVSGLKCNKDFFVGYSPERINPGDKEHRLASIIKVTSGSNQNAADFVDELYASIIKAGTYKAASIRVAEAAKVIENTQRDLNIALVNELAIIFNKIGIDTNEVLTAAATKWNFLPFKPGLVGGHCIGVDPYYLTYKAEEIGYHPQIILAGRRLNDSMGAYVAGQLVMAMIKQGIVVNEANVLMLGLTFKENCPDLRNSRVIDIVTELESFSCNVDVYDPNVSESAALLQSGVSLKTELKQGFYDGIIVAVAHQQFINMGAAKIRALGKGSAVLFDLKSIFEASQTDLRL